MKTFDLYKLPARVLFLLGLIDIIRGIAHTFLLKWSSTHIAHLDITDSNQLFLLGAFGISNFLTGFIYLLISMKARELSPYILIMIPAAYLLELIGVWSDSVFAEAKFYGRYFMYTYFAVCVVTFAMFLFQKHRPENKKSL